MMEILNVVFFCFINSLLRQRVCIWLNFGQQIRQLRKSKNISLVQLSKELEVSPAYLSNLENGKTETIQLSVLNKLQDKLFLNLDQDRLETSDEFRLRQLEKLLKRLLKDKPEQAYFLLNLLESGLNTYSDLN